MRQILLIITVVAMVGCGSIAEVKSGLEFDALFKKADAGDAQAQFEVGLAYSNSHAMAKLERSKHAFIWVQKAAKQGHVGGQFYLGYFYDKGYGVERDFKEAFNWYQKAANRADESRGNYSAMAQTKIAMMYAVGEGVEKDLQEMIKWVQKAANQGYATAQWRLGDFYYDGLGVDRDFNEAIKWYLKAANQGHLKSQHNLAALYTNGLGGVERNYVTANAWLTIARMNSGPDVGTIAFKRLEELNKLMTTQQRTVSKKGILVLRMIKANPEVITWDKLSPRAAEAARARLRLYELRSLSSDQ